MFSRLAHKLGIPTEEAGLVPKLAVGLLLLAHVAWLGVHLTLVAEERINPWKLGGYGMYTVPNPLARTHVALYDNESGKWVTLANDQANSFNFDNENYLHVFRCNLPSKDAFIGFMDENPHLRHRPLTIVLSEQQFSRDPVDVSREIYARMEIRWTGRTVFAVKGVVCNDVFEGTVEYQPPS